jgi:serine phosphatase RsbU (regulator of sigma subunit)
VIISFTDGYPDQFGGVKGKKLKYKPFKQFFLDNSSHSLENLKLNLEHSFEEWKGDLEQIDDVCVVAVKV